MLKSNAQIMEELNGQIAALKRERDQLKNEARNWTEKRNAFHEQIKILRTEAKVLKEKRDEANRQVNILKSLREQAKTEQKEKRIQLLEAKEKMRVLMGKKPPLSLRDVEKDIEAIDWKIQTTPLPVKDEKVLVEEVKKLEKQRAIHKQIQAFRDTAIAMESEERASATRAKLNHEKLVELAEESRRLHERMVDLLTKAQNLKAEADNAHLKYLELRQKTDEINQKCDEKLIRIAYIKQEIQKKDKEHHIKRQEELRDKTTKEAREKLRRGEKLTWDEFKLLSEEESTAES